MAFLVSLRDLYVLPFSRRKDNLYESVKKFVKTGKEDLNAYFTASLRILKFIISILQLPFRVINVTCKYNIEPVFQFLNLSFLSLNRLSSTALASSNLVNPRNSKKLKISWILQKTGHQSWQKRCSALVPGGSEPTKLLSSACQRSPSSFSIHFRHLIFCSCLFTATFWSWL